MSNHNLSYILSHTKSHSACYDLINYYTDNGNCCLLGTTESNCLLEPRLAFKSPTKITINLAWLLVWFKLAHTYVRRLSLHQLFGITKQLDYDSCVKYKMEVKVGYLIAIVIILFYQLFPNIYTTIIRFFRLYDKP